MTCAAKTDTTLANWLSRQSPAGSRLLPLVSRPDDLVALYGAFRWQGELERLGRQFATILAEKLGPERFTDRMNADLRTYFSMLDRQSSFATGIGMVGPASDANVVVRQIVEQPSSEKVIDLEGRLDALFRDQDDEAGKFITVGTLLTYSKVQREGAQEITSLSTASPTHLLRVASSDPQVAEVEMKTLIASLGDNNAPEGVPAIAAMRVYVDRMIAMAASASGQTYEPEGDLRIDLALRVDDGRSLALDVELPLAQIQEAIARAGLMSSEPGGSRR